MFSKILLPIDLEELAFSDRALALALKGCRESGTELHLVSVIPDNGTPVVAACFQQAAIRKATQRAEHQLQQYAQQHIPEGIKAKLTVLSGNPAGQLLSHARDLDTDLIIMAAHNKEWLEESVMGSTTGRLVDKARCSVVVLRREQNPEPLVSAATAV